MNWRQAPWISLLFIPLFASLLGGVTGYRAYDGIPIETFSPVQILLVAALVLSVANFAVRSSRWASSHRPLA